MGAFWVVAETRHWASVVEYIYIYIYIYINIYIYEDVNDLAVVPFRFPLEVVGVVIENSSGSGGNGIGGGKTSECEDFVCECFPLMS